MADSEKFIIPLDSQNFKKSVASEEVMHHIINGRQNEVLAYDFSHIEERQRIIDENMMEVEEMRNDQVNAHDFVSDNQKKRRDFGYYHPNRDFNDELEHLQLKKVDNGEFWDNGYR
jgi:hypothetical protein